MDGLKCLYCDSFSIEPYAESTYYVHYQCNCCYNKFVRTKNKMYIICRDWNDPEAKSIPGPSKTFDSIEQANTVAKKMALQYNRDFYICKVIGKTKRVEVSIEEV